MCRLNVTRPFHGNVFLGIPNKPVTEFKEHKRKALTQPPVGVSVAYRRGYVLLDAHGTDRLGEIHKRVQWVFEREANILDIAFKTLGRCFSLRLHVETSAPNAKRLIREADNSRLFKRSLDRLTMREFPFVVRSIRAERHDLYFDAMDHPGFVARLTDATLRCGLNVCYLSGTQYTMPMGAPGFNAHMIVECQTPGMLHDLTELYDEFEHEGWLTVHGPYSHRERVENGRERRPRRRNRRDAA